jgi:phage shock protein PspC (stress-responsive transcriptional regulator)
MDKTITIGLGGQPGRYRLEEAAYDHLKSYLDRAAAHLPNDPDRAEVLGDLERSVGDRLAALVGSDDRLVTAAEVDRILEEIGAVDTGHEPLPEEPVAQPRPRKLHRIKEGQQIAGVCNGLAAYAELRVDWVRTIFIFGTVFTAVIYIVLAFVLPITETREA